MIINNQDQHLEAFKWLHLLTLLAVLLYCYFALHLSMSGLKMHIPNTKWDMDQDLHMICLLTTLKSSPDVGSANFKMAELNQVAETLNKEFTQAGGLKTAKNVGSHWNQVSAWHLS